MPERQSIQTESHNPLRPGGGDGYGPIKSVDSTSRMLVAAIILAFCVVFAFLHELLRRCDQQQASRAIALAIGEGIARDLDLASPAKGSCQASSHEGYWRDWCETRLHNDSVLAVDLFDAGGTTLAGACRTPEFQRLLQDFGRELSGMRCFDDPAHRDGHFVMLKLSLPRSTDPEAPQRLALLLRLDQPLAAGLTHGAAFYLPLIAMGISCCFMGHRRLRASVIEPLMALSRSASTGDDSHRTIVQREDELGVLARCLGQLRDELEHWRDHAQRVERRMNSKVCEETQRITRDLNRVQREVWVDALTGVKNRRLLQERLPTIFDAQKKARKDLAIIMFDLDHFKVLNDSLGHWAGDELLAFTGELLRSCTRGEDVVARYGGDEFAVILPGAAEHEAVLLAERVIAMFRQRAKMIAKVEPTPSMTAGVASLHAHNPTSHRELLTLADRALYIAKRSGRSRAHVLNRHEPCAV